jgi:hypothetical protein
MMNSNMVGLMTVENTTSKVEIDNEFNLENADFEMAIELAAEAAEIESSDLNTAKLTQVEINENSAKERLANIQKIIEERRNGKMPEFYNEHSEEAEEKKKADKNAVMNELKDAQDELDKASTEAYAMKLSLASKDKKQEYSVPVKFEHTCEIDDTNIVKRQRNEYVYMFKANMRRTALATLDMCRVVYEAEKSLSDADFHEFCNQINYKSDSSTIRKFSTIGKVYPRFIQYAEQLPAAWTSIYALTQIAADDFELCIKGGYQLNKLTGGEIGELVKKTRDISNSVSPFKQEKKTLHYSVASVYFTKTVDDADFRLLQKAFDEIASRLPVKLVVKKEAAEYFEKRRAQRYEKLKVEANDAMVKPDKWDYGIAANQVNTKPELKVAA